MAIEAKAKIVIRGGSEALRTISGVQKATRAAGAEGKKAAAEQAKAAMKAAKDQERAAKAAAAEAKRLANTQAKEAKRAADAVAKEEQRKLKEIERSHAQAARAIGAFARAITQEAKREAAKRALDAKREAEKAAKAQEEALRRRNGRARGFLGGVTGGVLAGAASAAGTARGIAGIADVGERVRNANNFRERLIVTATQAGVTDEKRQQIQGQIMSTAAKTGIDPSELLGALEVAQKQFNGFEKFAGIMETLATTAKAGGASVDELTGALGYIQQAFNLTSEQSVEALNLMVGAASKGSVEVSDFARDFAASAGIFASTTGQTGIAGVRQFLGTSQGVATGGFGSAESATRLDRFIEALQDNGTVKALKGIGVHAVGKDGKVDVGNVLDQLATNKKFAKASVRSGIFKETRALQAVDALLAARARVQGGDATAVDFKTIAGIDAGEGAALTKQTFGKLQGEGALALQQEAAKAQNDVIANLGKYNEQILFVTQQSMKLEKSFGSLSLWADSIAATGAGAAGGSLLLSGALGGGGAGGAAAAAGKAGGVLGKVGGALQVAGVGIAAYEIATALGADKLGEWLGNWAAGGDVERAAAPGLGGGGAPIPAATVQTLERPTVSAGGSKSGGPGARAESLQAQQLQEQRETNKQMKRLAETLERRPAPPVSQPRAGR